MVYLNNIVQNIISMSKYHPHPGSYPEIFLGVRASSRIYFKLPIGGGGVHAKSVLTKQFWLYNILFKNVENIF